MDRYTYHFVMNPSQTIALLKDTRLLPVNYLPDTEGKRAIIHDYAERARNLKISKSNDDIIASEAYFKDRYDKLYKPILKREYFGNYGIYTTPIPVFKLEDKYDSAIRFNIENLNFENTILQISGRVIVKLSEKNFDLYCKPFLDNFEMTKKIWDSNTKLKFKKIPQIVVFENELPFTQDDIMLRGEF